MGLTEFYLIKSALPAPKRGVRQLITQPSIIQPSDGSPAAVNSAPRSQSTFRCEVFGGISYWQTSLWLRHREQWHRPEVPLWPSSPLQPRREGPMPHGGGTEASRDPAAHPQGKGDPGGPGAECPCFNEPRLWRCDLGRVILGTSVSWSVERADDRSCLRSILWRSQKGIHLKHLKQRMEPVNAKCNW